MIYEGLLRFSRRESLIMDSSFKESSRLQKWIDIFIIYTKLILYYYAKSRKIDEELRYFSNIFLMKNEN